MTAEIGPAVAAVLSDFSDREIVARLPTRCPRQVEYRVIPDYCDFTNRFYLERDRSTANAKRAVDRKLGRL